MSFCCDDEEADYSKQFKETLKKHAGDDGAKLRKALAYWHERARLAPCEVMLYTPHMNAGAIDALNELLKRFYVSRQKPAPGRPKRKVIYRLYDVEQEKGDKAILRDEYERLVRKTVKFQAGSPSEAHAIRKCLKPGHSAEGSLYVLSCEAIRNYKHVPGLPPIRSHSSKLRGFKRERFDDRMRASGEAFNLVYYGIKE